MLILQSFFNYKYFNLMKITKFISSAKDAMFLMFGTAAIILALGTIFTNPAHADTIQATNSTGKIMMDQNSFVHNGSFYFHVLVWDTETGKAKMYNFDTKGGVFSKAPYQLPSSPLY
jgi:hypothetical protein